MNRRDFLRVAGSGAAALASMAAAQSASASPVMPPTSASPRGRLELSDNWLFQPDPWGEGQRRRYYDATFDDSLWRKITVPRGFDHCAPGLESYEGKGWYRTLLRVPADWQGRRVVLRFEGVNYRCRVWLNGQLLGEHADGFLPFEFPVHQRLRFDQPNSLAVLVDNTRQPGEVPGIQRGWRNTGGILREVALIATGKRWIDGADIAAEPDGPDARISVRVRLSSLQQEPLDVSTAGQVVDAEGRVLASFSAGPTRLSADATASAELSSRVAAVTPWSPATPALYRLRIALTAAGQTLDTIEMRFGFRRIERRGAQLLLNGQPLYLTGFNRHEDSPVTGMATDLKTARQDLLDIQRAGANFVRFCHYPHHPGELDLCDELGLLVMAEIPLWQWDDRKEDAAANASKLAAAKRQLQCLIARDRNHPSVIFWSVSNENHAYQPQVRDGDRELIALAQKLDPTRLVVHVCSYFWADGAFDTDDVICINGYPNIPVWDVRPGAARDPDHPGAYFRAMIDELHQRYPDKPILLTEFGHPCFAGVQGCQFGEDTQAKLIEDAFSGTNAPYCCGAAIWCYADHPWPEEPYFYALTMSNFGVVTRQRQPRRGYAAARRIFIERQRSRANSLK